MSKFPSLPLFTDAFIADTGHLNAQETGAYLLLIMMAWRTPDCRLPDDDEKLARWARVDRRTWLRIKPAVMEFWTIYAGFWSQKRLSKERDIVSKRADAARMNGKHGGRPKSLKNNDLDNPAGSASLTQQKAPNPNPIKPPKAPKGAEPEGFAEWWGAYPKRDGVNSRAAAAARYAQVVKSGVPPETLLVAVRAYAAELTRKDKIGTEYVKQAKFWLSLKDRLWEDYAAKAQVTARPVAAVPPAPVADETGRGWVREWQVRCGYWPRHQGPPPDDPRTRVPPHILAEFGLGPEAGPSEPPRKTGTDR